jgi:predicted nucleic acid-binding protein
LALDTMVFSYHLFDHPQYAPLTSVVLDAIESGKVAGLTSAITVAEVLTVPALARNRRAMQDYELYLTHFPNLRIVPLDTTLARETAWVRAASRLRMPDAAQVAAARLSGADAMVTNDRRWLGKVSEPRLVLLGNYLD